MKHFLNKSFLVTLLLISSIFVAKAQLRFPNGIVLNLHTNINYLYFETEIRFYTGSMMVDNYNWEKISDSIDYRWLIGSCFNGDCWNGLPQYGTFIKAYGINDTTGFIRFHIETYDTTGKSVIKYRVVNKNNPADQAELTFNVTFEKVTGIKSESGNYNPIKVLYNDANHAVNIQFNKAEQLLCGRIIDINGKIVREIPDINNDMVIYDMTKGIYIVELKSRDHCYKKKFISY